jgi:uncharacterized protein YecE (DUF72 family)
VRLSVGTSGYSYKEWKGSFYPEKLPAKEMLAHYAKKLPAVEINNTFYRLPKAGVLETWAEQVPAGFRFSLKASRRITHFKRLKEAGDETSYLLDTAGVLGDKLGVVLFQLPPHLKKDLPRLAAFVEALPPGTPAAFEFRHGSWEDDEVRDCLRSRNCALVLADTDEADPPAFVPTADWGYLRLRRTSYDEAALDGWRRKIAEQPWKEAFVFFKHEDEAAGPRMAAEFLARGAAA